MAGRAWYEMLSLGTSVNGSGTYWPRYKAVLESFHNNMVAAGFTHVSSVAGQVDISAIASAPAQYTSYHFLVYELNDSLSGTKPIYMKFNFMIVNDWAQTLYVLWQVGTTINETTAVMGGQVTDQRAPASVIPSSNIYGENIKAPSIFSRQEGFAAVLFNMGGTAYNGTAKMRASCSLIIERTQDENGNFTIDGYTVFGCDQVAYNVTAMLLSRTFHGMYDSGWVSTTRRPCGDGAVSTSGGGTIILQCMKLGYGGVLVPAKNLISYYYGQYAQNKPFTAITLDSGAKGFCAVGYGNRGVDNEGQALGSLVDPSAPYICLAVGFE